MGKKVSEIISGFKAINFGKMRPKDFLIRESEYSKKAAENVTNNDGYQIVKNCDICGLTEFRSLNKKGNNIFHRF